MQKRTKIIAAVVILLVAAMIGMNWGKKKPINYTSAKVERGDVVQTVSATGEVEAATKVDLKFTSSEKIKEINVKVGDNINQGAVIARLDTANLDAQLLQAQAALNAAQANYRTLVDGASSEEIALAQTQVDNAQIALTSAEQALNDTNNSAQKDIANAQVALASAQVTLENTKTSNDNSIKNAYDSAWDTVNSSLSACDDALDTNKTVLENSDAENTLSVLNSSYLLSAEQSKDNAANYYNAAVSFRDSVASSKSNSDVDSAIIKVQDALDKTREALSYTSLALQATVTSSELSQTELDSLKASISASKTSISTAISALTAKKQAISTQVVTNQTSLNTAQASLNSAQSNLAAVQSAATAKINSAQNAVYSRQGDLKQAQDNLVKVKAAPSASRVEASRAAVNQAQANVDLIQSQINEHTLVAPQDGIVTMVSGEVGEVVSVTEPFTSMIISNGYEIKANIAEVDIAKLKVNDEVTITFDALGTDKEFSGRVSEIDPAETVISGVVYYKVTTLFTDGNGIIKPGMTANMDILTAKKENALKIPFQAVKEKDGKKYVQLVSGKEKFDDVNISVGLKGDSDYEILSGLSDGQEVVTFMGK